MKRTHFALPEIYDDSLSYYDVLRKLIKSMHVISDNLNKIPEQIANEAKARLLGDQNLQQNINTEVSAREQADTTLQQNINTEVSAREQADTTLQQNINSEATTREQADQEIREGVSNKISELKGDLSKLATFTEIGFEYPKNLLNVNDVDYMSGYRASNISGNPSADTAWDLSGYISVNENENIIISRSGSTDSVGLAKNRQNCSSLTRIYGYNENKEYIPSSYAYNGGIEYYIVPSEVKYLRVSISTDTEFHKYMVEKNTVLTDYEDWHEPIQIEGSCQINKEVVKNIPLSEQENDAGFITIDEVPEHKVVVPHSFALPSIIYGFVGVPMQMYFHNFMLYENDDVHIRIANSNNGRLYKKRWEYTPNAEKTFTQRIVVCDHNFDELNNDSFNVVIKGSSVKSSLKVLVIGDSTVNQHLETQKMLDLATEQGYELTLLGTRGVSGSLNQHEGRGGWTAKMYCENSSNTSGSVTNAFFNPSSQTFDFSYYMNQQGYKGVDCVFIQLGINDIFSAKTDKELETLQSDFYTNIDKMIASIKSYDSNIRIIINTIIPSESDQDKFSEFYPMNQTVWRNHRNTYLTNIKTIERYKNTSNVYVSWYCSMIDVDTNMQGDVHPNTDGYNQLGTQMYATMRAIN